MGKAECKKTPGCTIAEYSTGGTCCTSSSAWKGYVVCGAPKLAATLPGTTLKCGADAGPICMGYNIKCFKTTLAGCKAECKATAKTKGCKIAEYSASSKTCCTSAIATKATCKGSFTSSSAWKGYVVC